ncbi:beta-lactamase [Herbiconiux sp. L3-i23]|nr:beta-lactamase [Herbiconiux sp. L3-i23]
MALLLALSACGTSSTEGPPPQSASPAPTATEATPTRAAVDAAAVAASITALEQEYGARVGVHAVDTGDRRTVSHRADERFEFASSIKAFLAAALLATASDAERATTVRWSEQDVQGAGYSPVTSERVGTGMTLDELAEASVRQSDNTATNLVFASLGGPHAFEGFLAEHGDDVTSSARTEPGLNDVTAGDDRDTTTPRAFAADLETFLLGDGLAPADQQTLLEWMSGNATGDALIRAGAPAGWAVADKSGGAGPIRNDVAVVHPPGRSPIVVAVLTTRLDPETDYDDALVARAASVVLSALAN